MVVLGFPSATCCPPLPRPHHNLRHWLLPENGWSLPGHSGFQKAECHSWSLAWTGQARTHPDLLLFSLELRVDLLRARVLPCPAFVASLSPCTRIGSSGRWKGSSYPEHPEPQAVSSLRCSHQRLQNLTYPSPNTTQDLCFPTLPCSKGQKRQHVVT